MDLQSYQESVRIAKKILEEALVCSKEQDVLISIGGPNGPLMEKEEVDEMIKALKKMEKMKNLKIVKEYLKENPLPAIICQEDSFWNEFQLQVGDIEK